MNITTNALFDAAAPDAVLAPPADAAATNFADALRAVVPVPKIGMSGSTQIGASAGKRDSSDADSARADTLAMDAAPVDAAQIAATFGALPALIVPPPDVSTVIAPPLVSAPLAVIAPPTDPESGHAAFDQTAECRSLRVEPTLVHAARFQKSPDHAPPDLAHRIRLPSDAIPPVTMSTPTAADSAAIAVTFTGNTTLAPNAAAADAWAGKSTASGVGVKATDPQDIGVGTPTELAPHGSRVATRITLPAAHDPAIVAALQPSAASAPVVAGHEAQSIAENTDAAFAEPYRTITTPKPMRDTAGTLLPLPPVTIEDAAFPHATEHAGTGSAGSVVAPPQTWAETAPHAALQRTDQVAEPSLVASSSPAIIALSLAVSLAVTPSALAMAENPVPLGPASSPQELAKGLVAAPPTRRADHQAPSDAPASRVAFAALESSITPLRQPTQYVATPLAGDGIMPQALAPQPALPLTAAPARSTAVPRLAARTHVETESLGAVTIALSTAPDQALNVHFTVDRSTTAHVLIDGARLLDGVLQASGSRLDQLSVDVRGGDPRAPHGDPSGHRAPPRDPRGHDAPRIPLPQRNPRPTTLDRFA